MARDSRQSVVMALVYGTVVGVVAAVVVGSVVKRGEVMGLSTRLVGGAGALMVVVGVFAAGLAVRRIAKGRAVACARCGYDTTHSVERCPECGLGLRRGTLADWLVRARYSRRLLGSVVLVLGGSVALGSAFVDRVTFYGTLSNGAVFWLAETGDPAAWREIDARRRATPLFLWAHEERLLTLARRSFTKAHALGVRHRALELAADLTWGPSSEAACGVLELAACDADEKLHLWAVQILMRSAEHMKGDVFLRVFEHRQLPLEMELEVIQRLAVAEPATAEVLEMMKKLSGEEGPVGDAARVWLESRAQGAR